MEAINSILSGIVLPLVLIVCGAFFAARQRFFFILHPVKLVKALKEAAEGDGVSPFRALTHALAGTLGVGNMAGVATAITAGGAGAVFWMWISAVFAMSIKYREVYMGVLCRRHGKDGYFGGAMYYINDTFSRKLPRLAPYLGGAFAVLCLINSLLTGNMIQMRAAASVFPQIPPLLLGGAVGAVAFVISFGKAKRVSSLTMGLIPVLSAFYIGISLWVIIANSAGLPAVISEIFTSAFSLKSMGGGIGGYAITRAVRFGVTRGIFSNEAGLGTSPSAHSCANTKSPHHQGCFGIFEVFADTIVLCSMTAFVILLSDGCEKGLDGIPLTLYSYSSLVGGWAGTAVGISVILFAFATVICQSAYGDVALCYLGASPSVKYIYLLMCAAACIGGCVMSDNAAWQAADTVVSLMIVLNISCLAMPDVKKEGEINKKGSYIIRASRSTRLG